MPTPFERYGITPMLLKHALKQWSHWDSLNELAQKKLLEAATAHDLGQNLRDQRNATAKLKELGVPGQAIVIPEARAVTHFLEEIYYELVCEFSDKHKRIEETQRLFWLIVSLLKYTDGSEASSRATEEAEHPLPTNAEQTQEAHDRR